MLTLAFGPAPAAVAGAAPEASLDFLFAIRSGATRSDTLTAPRTLWVERARREVYVLDVSQVPRVMVFRDEQFLSSFRLADVRQAAGLAADSRGTFYVSDGVDPRIHMFNFQGRSAGSIGLENLQQRMGTLRLGALYVTASDRLVAVAQGPKRVLVIDPASGQVEHIVGNVPPNETAVGDLLDVAVDSQGRYHLLDLQGTCVLVFGPQGRFLFRYGTYGGEPLCLGMPHGVDQVDETHMGILEATRAKVVLYDMMGNCTGEGGRAGRDDGAWSYPGGMRADRERSLVYTVEMSPPRLQAFQLKIP